MTTEDPRQALRIRRFYMATASYCMWASLVAYSALAGYFRMSIKTASTWFLGAVVVINLFIYILFRTGLNKKFRDPSLTLFQMAMATLIVMITLYFAREDARGVLLLIYPVVFVFGFFRLSVGQFLFLSGLALSSYALSIWFLALLHPFETRLSMEILRWVILACVLVWFSMLGAYVNRLRQKTVQSNAELKEALTTIEELAVRDPLTGVFNRRKLMEILERERARAERYGHCFSICLLDMDHFKKVNDTHGHLAGDDVLKAFGSGVRAFLREADAIARYGGEEFVVVLPETAEAGALELAERIRGEAANWKFTGMPEDFSITISIGVAGHLPGQTIPELFARADRAMYRAKARGRNRVEKA